MKSLGEKIKEERTKLGYTQERFANEIGFSRTNLCDVEKGRNNGSLKFITKVAELCNKPISYFMDDTPITQYEVLDNSIDFLIERGFVDEEGNVDDDYKELLFNVLKKEIKLKIEKRR